MHSGITYDDELDIILQKFRVSRGMNNSTWLQADQKAESYAFLKLQEHLQVKNRRGLSTYQLAKPDRAFSQLSSSCTESTEAE